jgi:hypothetical protein
VAKQGDYTLALKENHPEVCVEARELFEGIDELSCSFPAYTDVPKDHGRIEKRERGCVRTCLGLPAWPPGPA